MMFGNGNDKKPSLLMLASRENEDVHQDANRSNVHELHAEADSVSKHRRARSARRTAKPNGFLAALGMQKKESIQEDAAPHLSARPEFNDARSGKHFEQAAYPSAPPQEYDMSYDAPRDEAFKPLIDPAIMISAIWRWRWPIVGLTLLGGALGAAYAISTPKIYSAYTQLIVDPRQVKLVERDLTPEFLGNDAALSIVDSQLESVISTPVLKRVIAKLNLDQDPEFSGESDTGLALFDGISFVRSLFSGENPIEASERETLNSLRESVYASRTPNTFVFTIGAHSHSPNKAAEIANALSEAFIESQNEKKSDFAKQASSALDGQLAELQEAVESAERRAEEFAQSNNLRRVEGLTLSDTNLVATSNQLTEARAATIRAQSLADAAREVTLNDAINGGLPAELSTSALTTFRSQYASLAQNAASLEAALGPRHPRLEQAIVTRDAARNEISAELKRIVSGTQANLRRAVQNEQKIAASLARAKSEAGQDGDALIKLRELETEISAARTVYQNALLRARETNQLSELSSVNVDILAEADIPSSPSSTSRKVVMMGGFVGGLMLGLGLAFIAGLRDCLMPKNAPNKPSQSPNGGRSRRPEKRQNHNQMGTASAPFAHNPSPTASAESEQKMYPGAPYYPYAAAQQPEAHSMHPQQPMPNYVPMQPHGYPAYGQPPQVQVHPMPPMPAGYANHYPPQQQMPQYQPHPHMGRYPQQQPMMPSAPQYPPMQQWQQPAPPQQAYPTHQMQEDAEMEELRQSVQDIRDVVDQLAQRRGTKRRFG
ncbi:Wzz/FepE/Etk N-terminal domain-containing protein [Ahrensia kielensis]|uniref:Wzz/FepE/Etk N-terminal domain-containing protein n=1 Tax=Ahrensia kielensis TaxID=76980 RepID=A0ABU9T1Q5_9HYPH